MSLEIITECNSRPQAKSDTAFPLIFRWPRGSFSLIKFTCWMFALILGMCIGKWVVHGWFFCKKLRLKIFTEDGQGSWMVMFLTSLLSLFIFSFAYNGFLMLEGKNISSFNTTVALISLCEQRSLCQEDWRDSCSQFTMMEGNGW